MMRVKPLTFHKGGVHPQAAKLSASVPIETLPVPDEAVILLGQHIGAPAKPVVNKGDHVVVGQLLAESGGFVSANIHSSVSGTVSKIDGVVDASGYKKPAIFIKTEGDEWDSSIDRSAQLDTSLALQPKEMLGLLQKAGIVGMGGATFPTHVKLSVPEGKRAEFLIVNGVECEPYLTADHRLMLEAPEQILVGTQILAKVLGSPKVIIAIELNKPDAIALLRSKAEAMHLDVTVQPLKVKYPQGGEKQLIEACVGRQVPPGKLPIDVGAVVQNVGTVYAVYEAVQKHKPLFERVLTVTGKNLPTPKNYRVRVGTPISQVIAAAGGLPDDTGKVISGGPMMGKALKNVDAPVTKGTSGILLMPETMALRPVAQHCIRCSKCSFGCPMGLEPFLLVRLAKRSRLEDLEHEDVMSCIECGSCSFTCPAGIPLLDFIRMGKAATGAMLRARRAK